MRRNGVLMHLSSLPGDQGIGTMGKSAHEFVDFLEKAGQSVWQLLPVVPTSYGDSPYASFSTFAGNPYFIDLDLLAEDGLLKEGEYETVDWGSDPERVDYGALYNNRTKVLRKAASRLLDNKPDEYYEFLEENYDWLPDYALFMALKDKNGGKSWLEWEDDERNYGTEAVTRLAEQYREDVDFYEAVQYLFFKQWKELRNYANGKGIDIIGDLPIYVALDSVDAWSHPELFQLDENRQPIAVAGCPPDGFSADGQLWGNPLYDWDYHKNSGYDWWLRRIQYLTKLYNIIRIDHFRGFDSYYAIPYGSTTAKNGEWKKGPGMDLFDKVKEKVPEGKIIAEDLGFLTDSVRKLLKDTGYPGMKILQFAFDSRDGNNNEYLPFNYPVNSVAYTGTHDNQTIMGWFETAPRESVKFAEEYLRISEDDEKNWIMMRELMASPSELSILTGQDLLGLGDESRMNTPSTVGINWTWRALPGKFTDELAEKLCHYTALYGRLPQKTAEEARAEEAAA